jgi:hypothetical protein
MTSPEPNDTALDPLLQQAVLELRTPVAATPAARASLRAALAAAAADTGPVTPEPVIATVIPISSARPRRAAGWFTDARALRFSPLGALAAASLLIAATAAVTARVVRVSTPAVASGPAVTPPPAGVQVVRFSLAAPRAQRVSLVGDFNGWDPAATALQERDGTWTVVIPVTPGRHQYGFVIDGTEWIADPQAAQTSDADFGTANSVVYVGS